ncbi:hypothetical protein AnigIFM59636_011066 [Aspergillus niger]|nr:hypothetical protein AnigIFM59636_011066 [Aspergillus niger]
MSQLMRFTSDPNTTSETLPDPEVLHTGPRLGGGYPLYNALAHVDLQSGTSEVYFPGRTHLVQEPLFIPKAGSTIEGDGYLMALVNHYESMTSELHLLDLTDFSKARAVIHLPVRPRPGLHGNWVDSRDMQSV